MAEFTGGPSVRLLPPTVFIPYSRVEIRWSEDFVGDGQVEVFDNADGIGTPIDTKVSAQANDQSIEFAVTPLQCDPGGGCSLVKADTTYFFKVTHSDPNGVQPPHTNGPAPFPSFFTGAQAIGDVNVDAPGHLARIQWDANVLGTGRVDYGINSPDELSADDQANTTSHNIELPGLALGTTYQYRVCNRHAIDGDCLAAKTGSFTTALGNFTAGPSVRVSPNAQVEIRWSANFGGDGKVELFDNPNASGAPINTKVSASPAVDHTLIFNVAGVIAADSTYFFKVTHHDPNNNRSDETNDPAPFPPVFTGVQAIGDVNVDAPGHLARIQWDANVLGTGRVDYGINSPDELWADDQANATSHNIELPGLALGTTYQYRVCNRHAIDGDCLAAKTGSFTTALGNFTAGPSVRVLPPEASIPFSRVEITWSANFSGDGKVDVFDNPSGTGTPVDTKVGNSTAPDQAIEFNVGGVVQADTTYYFKVTHHDPNNNRPDETNDPAPFPPFFTGSQAIGDVFVVAELDSAVVSWDANVIGDGWVEYGSSSPGDLGTVNDGENFTSHSIEIGGLSPGTTYQYRVSNRHAIDGGSLAEKTGSFTTLPGESGPFAFDGFFAPVDNLPILNSVKAGQAVPVKFSLGGDQGLDIFEPGYPKSQTVACDATAPVLGIEETVNAGGSSLTYDAASSRYEYVWKTKKAWAGTCRQLVLKLTDGTYHQASFKLK